MAEKKTKQKKNQVFYPPFFPNFPFFSVGFFFFFLKNLFWPPPIFLLAFGYSGGNPQLGWGGINFFIKFLKKAFGHLEKIKRKVFPKNKTILIFFFFSIKVFLIKIFSFFPKIQNWGRFIFGFWRTDCKFFF